MSRFGRMFHSCPFVLWCVTLDTYAKIEYSANRNRVLREVIMICQIRTTNRKRQNVDFGVTRVWIIEQCLI